MDAADGPPHPGAEQPQRTEEARAGQRAESREESYLRVDPVLPVSLTQHQSSHLGHRQPPDVQLEELLWVVVVGKSTDVHSHR